MQAWFHEVADYLAELLETGQEMTCRLEAEDTEWVRVNGGLVRHAGSVAQRILRVALVRGDRQVEGTVQLGGAIAQDRYPLRLLHSELAQRLETVPPDPHLVFPAGSDVSEERGENRLAPIGEVLPFLGEAPEGVEAVGRYLGGRIAEGFATSQGMRRWFETWTFDLELSLVIEADRAVKVSLGGPRWSAEELARRLARAGEHVERLRGERTKLAPGRHRAYLAPAALRALLVVLGNRGAFSRRALESGLSPFAALHRDGRRLSPSFTLFENLRLGWCAPFAADGHRRPAEQLLVEAGHPRGLLVSPRTGAEHGVPHTASDPAEVPISPEVAAGHLEEPEIARAVGDGLWLENLHYANLSDLRTAGVTALTRFAAFRVEGGALAGPIEVARVDDSALELLGERLAGVTAERQRLPETRSYGRRALGGALLPGIVVEGLRVVG